MDLAISIVGHCPNGDYVIADVGSEFGVVRYICHEECAADNDFEGFSEYSKVVATSLGEFVFGLDQGTIGSDYFDEPSGVDIHAKKQSKIWVHCYPLQYQSIDPL